VQEAPIEVTQTAPAEIPQEISAETAPEVAEAAEATEAIADDSSASQAKTTTQTHQTAPAPIWKASQPSAIEEPTHAPIEAPASTIDTTHNSAADIVLKAQAP